jgi:hypothetical protein
MKDWMLTDEQMDKAYILGSYEGDKFGHSAIAKAQARKVVGEMDKIGFQSGGSDGVYFSIRWNDWQQLRKDVES